MALLSRVEDAMRRLNRDAASLQTEAEIAGAAGDFSKAMRLHAKACAIDPSLIRKLETPTFSKAYTPTVMCAVSNICNINCRICETQNSLAAKGNMDRQLVMNIIDQCKERGIHQIILHHVNEPLLHPAIFDILKYLEDNGMSAVVSTNGNEAKSVINRASKHNALPNKFNIRYSIDAGRRETYNEIRRGGDFDTVLSGMRLMSNFCIERGISLTIGSNYVMTRKSIHELADFADAVGEFIPLDRMQFSFVNGNTPTGLNQYIIDNRVSDFVRRTPCDVPFSQMNILRDGRVSLCCVDFNEEVIVGDIRTQSIDEIWNGTEMGRHRKALSSQNVEKLTPLCRRCYMTEAAYVDPNPAIQQMYSLKASGKQITNEQIVNRIRFELMTYGTDLKLGAEPLRMYDNSDAFINSARP